MNEVPLTLGVTVTSIFAFLVVLGWVLLVFMPRWTRPDIYFAVTVKPSFRQTPEALQLERHYRRLVAIHSLIGLALTGSSLLVLAKPDIFLWLLSSGLFWQMCGSIIAFVSTRRHLLPYAATPVGQRQAILQPREVALAGRWWWSGPLLILLGFATNLILRWDDIPDRFPTHWGPSGSPDSWATRSFLSVFATILMGLCIWATMFTIAAALPRFARRISARGAAAERERKFMHITQWILLGTAYWLAVLMGTTSLLPLLVGMNDALPSWFFWMIGFELVLVAAMCVILARSGQGGWRLDHGDVAEPESADDQPVGDRTPDSAWKLGIFYFNPDDPALFVEKRFGIGWDLNWGRPAAWLGMLVLLLAMVGVPIALLVAANQ